MPLLRKRISVYVGFAVVSFASSRALADTLADVVAYAYDNNPGLLSQRAAQRALDENYVQARSNFGPNIGANVSATSYDNTLAGQELYANTNSESLIVTQPIYTGGRYTNQLSEAEAQIMAGREALRSSEQDMLEQIVGAYVAVRRDEALLKVNQDTVVALEKEASDTEARFAAGQVTKTDVAQARARLADAQASLDNARASLGVSRAQFISVVGQTPGTLEATSTLDLPATIEQALGSAEQNNPQLLAAKYTEQKSRARVAEAKAGRLPTVSVQLGYQHTPYLPYTPQPYNSAATATVNLTQPIFTSGQLSSQIRQASEQNDSDRLAIDDTRNRMIAAVSTAWEQLSSARNQLKALEEEVQQDTIALSGNTQEEKVAQRSTIDVLNAELELTNAEQNILRARAQEFQAEVALLAAMGVLNVTLLSPSTPSYSAAAEFRKVEHKGETPLEWPARAIDGLGGERMGKPAPASVAEVYPTSIPLPPSPAGEQPLPSILTTLNQPLPTSTTSDHDDSR